MRLAVLLLAALAVGCGGRSGAVHESLADVEPASGYWTIRAACEGGRFDVDFGAERLSAAGLGYASNEDFAVECGDPERLTVSDEELRDRTPTGAELAQPTFVPTELSCRAGGSLVVEAHPVWGAEGIVGAALRISRADLTILQGAVLRKGYASPPSEVQWMHALCRPS